MKKKIFSYMCITCTCDKDILKCERINVQTVYIPGICTCM